MTTEDGLDSQITERMISWVKNSCAFRLSKRMMSEHELYEAVKKKTLAKFPDLDVTAAEKLAQIGIDFCNTHRFLDDEAFTQAKTSSSARSGHSVKRIARDLEAKGIEETLIRSALEDVDDYQSALNYARKRALGPFRKVPLDQKRKAKEIGAMARNGFSMSIIKQVLDLEIDFDVDA